MAGPVKSSWVQFLKRICKNQVLIELYIEAFIEFNLFIYESNRCGGIVISLKYCIIDY